MPYLCEKSADSVVITFTLPRVITRSVSEQSKPLHTTARHLQITHIFTIGHDILMAHDLTFDDLAVPVILCQLVKQYIKLMVAF